MKLFNTVRIQTPESIELEFTLAGIGSRAFALMIDYLILNSSLLILVILTYVLAYSLQFAQVVGTMDITSQWVIAVMGLVIYGLYVGYFVGFETLWQGQTPGKRWVKIRVIRDDAQPVGLFQATLRSLLRPVDDILFIGFLMILLEKQEKRLGDWLASTLVVRTIKPTSQTLEVSAAAQSLAQKLIAESDLSQIPPDDFALVREYLQRRTTIIPKAQTKLSQQLAERMRQRLNTELVPWEVGVDRFLEAVYVAYQAQDRDDRWH
jgi:uncharacterized RDD family membrane protein YckC